MTLNFVQAFRCGGQNLTAEREASAFFSECQFELVARDNFRDISFTRRRIHAGGISIIELIITVERGFVDIVDNRDAHMSSRNTSSMVAVMCHSSRFVISSP